MNSIRIHEDKENTSSTAGIRQKQNTMAGQLQRRAALGVLDENQVRDRLTRKEKQKPQKQFQQAPLLPQPSNIDDIKNADKENKVVIPVAQFEAFRVYEDNMKKTNGRPVMPDVDEFYSRCNALVTKRDLMIMTFGDEKKVLTNREYHEVIKNKGSFDDSTDSIYGNDDEETEDCPDVGRVEEVETDESHLDMSIIEQVPESPRAPPVDSTERNRFFEVTEYREDIYRHLLEQEALHRPKVGYMKKQPDITYQMRSILVDWLVEVATEYKMSTETWYLAVNYIDRFLSYMSVVRAKLQLVGTAAMFIAGKYEEIYPPDIKKYVYITADTYCQRQILRMEQLILKVLHFDLSVPTPYSFITCISSLLDVPDLIVKLTMYLCELSTLEADHFIEILPSVLVSSALALARYTLDLEMWPEEYEMATTYKLRDLKRGIEFLSNIHNKAPTHSQRAIPEKYAQLSFCSVAQITAKPPIKFPEDCSAM